MKPRSRQFNRAYYIITVLFMLTALPLTAANPKKYNRLGVELGKKKKYEEAVKEFDRAIKVYDKNSAMTYHNKGWAHELQGNTSEAIKNYREALRRNGRQIVTGEKLGFLYYKSGDYINAVKVGEHVLRIDPNNKVVTKWLTDAYAKKLQQERALRLQKKGEIVEDTAAKKKKEMDKKKKIHQWVVGTVDYTIRTGYFFAGNKGYRYISDPGAMGNIMETIYVSFTPIKAWEFVMIAENPWLGGLSPNLLTHREIFESMYYLGRFMLGIGFMFNHHEGNFNFAQNLKEYDFKVGFLFAYTTKKMNFKVRFYPRLIPFDGKSNTGYTMDTDMLSFRFTYTVNKFFKYYTIFDAQDFYFFDHTTPQSNYYGVYDIGIGVSLGDINRNNTGFAWKMAIEYRQRFYLRDLGNTDPYSYLPNGSGWFGMDIGKWTKGNPFSGFRALGYELSFRVDEQILPYLFLYQKIIIEMGDPNEDHHEFNFKIGVGGMY